MSKKKFLRSEGVQNLLVALFATYLKFVYATQRWTYEGLDKAQGVWANQGQGAILAVWHAQIPISPRAWQRKRGAPELRILISKSSDGEFITKTMAAFGFGAIRGSRADEKSLGDKGGASAFRDMVRWLKGGGGIAITPDGPKGPAQVMSEGVPLLARMTGAPVLLVGIACNPCKRARSWDQTVFPLPFGRAAMVWDGPLTASRSDDPAELSKRWGAHLTALTERAEQLVA